MAVSVVHTTYSSSVDQKGRHLSWATTPQKALEGLSSSLEKGPELIEGIVEDFLYGKFGPVVFTDAFKDQWFNQLYIIRQNRLTESLAKHSLGFLEALSMKSPDTPLFPSDFIFFANRIADDAAFDVRYFKARHAVRDSIPLVARMIQDDGWAGMVRAEYIESYRLRYAMLEAKYGPSRFDRL